MWLELSAIPESPGLIKRRTISCFTSEQGRSQTNPTQKLNTQQHRIAIQNAAPGGATHVGAKRALRLIKRGEAVKVSEHSIRILSQRMRHKTVEERDVFKDTAAYYDCLNRRLKPQEQMRIPFTRPVY